MATIQPPHGEIGNQGSSWWAMDAAETALELRWPSNIDIYDRMRRTDAQCKSILSAATLPIRRTKWYVNPMGASDEVTRFVAANLGLPVKGERDAEQVRATDRFSWDDHLRLALLEMTFGHSFFEQVYRIDAGRAWLRRLAWRPPRTISKVNVADDGGLESIEQFAATNATNGRDAVIPVGQLVAYVHEREGGNWLGQSVLRPAYKFWLLKDRLLRVQAQTIDRNGMGVPIYTGPSFADISTGTDDDVTKLQQDDLDRGQQLAAAFRSGENAGASIPFGAKLELRGVTGTLPDALPVIRYYDEQISASVLANFLKLGGADSTGSYALGTTFADFFVMSLQSEALHIADTANNHIVNDLVDINFGTDALAPRIEFEEIGTQQHATAAGIAQLVGAGALLPEPSLEAYLRDMFDIPERDPEWKPVPTQQAATQQAANRAAALAAQVAPLLQEDA